MDITLINPHKCTLKTSIGCEEGIYKTALLKKWLKSMAFDTMFVYCIPTDIFSF